MVEPPLDDPRWCLMETAIEMRQRQTDNLPRAIVELDQGLASGELRSMRRDIMSGEAEFLFAAFWTKKLGIDSVDFPRGWDRFASPPRIVFHPTSAHEAAGRVEGWAYFVWKPDFDQLWPAKQPTAAQRRETRKPAGGAPPKFTASQQQWLREKYSSDLMAEPRLAKHDGAVPHVKELAKTKFGIEAGRNTLLQQIIRPVLRAAKNNQ